MSDSGFSRLPPGSRAIDPSVVQARPEQSVKIESARGDLRDVSRTIRTEGEVVKVKADGQVTIRADGGGEIDIRLSGRAGLQEGQRVELEIPPGHPPRQAVVKPAPAEPPLQHSSSSPAMPAPQTRTIPGAQVPAADTSRAGGGDAPFLPGSSPFPSTLSSPAISPEVRALLDESAPLPVARLSAPALPPVSIPVPVPLLPEAVVRLVPLSVMPPQAELAAPPLPVLAALPDSATDPGVFRPARPDAVFPPGQGASTGGMLAISSAPLSSSVLPPLLLPSDGKIPNVLALPSMSLPATAPPAPGVRFSAGSALPQAVFSAPFPVASSADHLALSSSMMKVGPPELSSSAHPVPFALAPGSLAQGGRLFEVRIADFRPEEAIIIAPPDGKARAQMPGDFGFMPSLDDLPSSPLTIGANVVAATERNFPILSVEIPGGEGKELFLMQFPASNLPAGTRLEILPVGPAGAPASSPAGAGSMTAIIQPPGVTLAFDLFSGWTWPAFNEAIQSLVPDVSAAGGAPAAQGGIAGVLPNPGNPAQMPHAMLFFIAAVRSGDVSGWMGEKAADLLRRDGVQRGKDLLARLTRDIAGLGGTMSDPVSQDWRGVAIPIYWQNEIQKAHLFYRRQPGGEDEEQPGQAGQSTRFIFDLHLDRIGDVQLDGLMKGKRLDLVLRTRMGFSRAMQVAMRQRYLDVLEAGRLTGDMAFQTRPDQWVKVGIRPSGLETTV